MILGYNRAKGEGCERGSNGVGTEVLTFDQNFLAQILNQKHAGIEKFACIYFMSFNDE